MPKKTKAKKIIAELRRKLELRETSKAIQPLHFRRNERIELQKKKRVEKRSSIFTQPKHGITETLPSFVMSDLKKSFFITVLAISLEFVLYYLLEGNGVAKLSPLIDKINW